jgi:hypothetical protein
MKKLAAPPGGDVGRHNADLRASRARLLRGGGYRDLSTVCVTPTRGLIPARAVQSWFALMTPMNQPFLRLFVSGMEVGEAYSRAVEGILADRGTARFQYLLTLEEDNLPPPDGVLRLHEGVQAGYDAVGGLYWTKGEGGQPMVYGDPAGEVNFRPQVPRPNCLQACRGLGMGFTLFRMALFRDGRLPKPWFRTVQEYAPGVGATSYTQDLAFFEAAGRLGYKFACHTGVLVGHLDHEKDVVW